MPRSVTEESASDITHTQTVKKIILIFASRKKKKGNNSTNDSTLKRTKQINTGRLHYE
jgi:hypothetical protein